MWQSSMFRFRQGRKAWGTLEVQTMDDVEVPDGVPALLRAAVAAALPFVADILAADKEVPWSLAIRLGSAEEGRLLNKTFRGKDYATNVLSFPSDDPAELGDIFIVPDVVAKEAAVGGKPFADHLTHLAVHGVLHVLGYDHEGPADTGVMEALETRILATLGLDDPYVFND